ncbi:MAG: response regulator [Clostridia bacterium]|nr:response regulator [Clostridia bacterium]
MKGTILIVDDIPENIHVLREILKDDYIIKAATRGQKALDIIWQDSEIDLVLLDIMMPEMNGYEVCRRLRKDVRTEFVPVIFVSAMGEVQDEIEGFMVGGNDYITKPVQPLIVKARVSNYIALYRQRVHLELIVAERTQALEQNRREILKRLSVAGEYRDSDTGNHVDRVGEYSEILGQALGMDEKFIDYLRLTAQMHDIGKIGIEDNILLKNGKLSDAERKRINRHPQIGADIIGEHDDALLSMARTIALTHHEKWDGSGYPVGLKGEEIPLEGRIVCMADIFDALMSKRPYKEPWPIEEVIEYIRSESGKTFDPKLVTVFMSNAARLAEVFFKDQKDEHGEDGGR